MENSSIIDAGKTSDMTFEEAKQNVIGVYPDAFCYIRNNEYIILSNDIHDIHAACFIVDMLGPYCKNESRAWELAWDILCDEMIEKLEE